MRILDGRDYFYQWDLNVFIVSEDFDTESEVHFENKFSRGALSLKATTLNGQTVVEVPNIMLQLSTPIKAYLYIQDEYGHRTIKEKVFEVKKRAKPVDYIYTEVESLTVSDYVKKALEEAKERGELAYTCKTYADYAEMVNELNAMQSDVYVEGQDIRILTLDVPDLWVAYVDRDYEEYTYTNDNAIIEALNANGFIKIGYYRLGALETQKVDLLDYVKNTDYATASKAGVVKATANNGIFCSTSGMLNLVKATDVEIDDKINNYKPIVSSNLDYAVKAGLSNNALEWTDEEKASARETIGAIGEIPGATANTVGGITANSAYGLSIEPLDNYKLKTIQATEAEIKAKSNRHKIISPNNLDLAVKSGITTNTIELTEDEKAAARNWIGAIKKPEKDAGGYYRVPITDAHGADGFLKAYNAPLQYAIVLYGTGGVVKTNAPIVDNDCANKKYVDDTLGDIASALDELHTYAQSLIGGDA